MWIIVVVRKLFAFQRILKSMRGNANDQEEVIIRKIYFISTQFDRVYYEYRRQQVYSPRSKID